MSQLRCGLPDVTLTRPNGLSRAMFFHVYSGANAIAFAQLSSRVSRRSRPVRSPAVAASSSPQAPGIRYCLKNIEVSQNYRNRGVGTALLQEILNFCRDERISALYGEAKGDIEELRRWYRDTGFTLDSVDNIEIRF